MIWLSAAIVILGALTFAGFRSWLHVRSGAPDSSPRMRYETFEELVQRVAAVEGRVSTIELQRAILRKVPDKG